MRIEAQKQNGREGGVLCESRMRFLKSKGYKRFERRKIVGTAWR